VGEHVSLDLVLAVECGVALCAAVGQLLGVDVHVQAQVVDAAQGLAANGATVERGEGVIIAGSDRTLYRVTVPIQGRQSVYQVHMLS